MSKNFIGKTELIDALTKSSNLDGVSKKTIATVVNELLPTILETVKNDKEVRLIGFGTFKKKHRTARTGRNPSSGEMMEIPESDSFGFKSNIKF